MCSIFNGQTIGVGVVFFTKGSTSDLSLSPQEFYITDCSNAVHLTLFSVLLVLVSVSVLFSPSMCLHDFR